MLKRLFNVITPGLAALSVFCMPVSASAAYNPSCCPPADCCQEEQPCCNNGRSALWGLVGAAAVGAAAGAITAAAIDSGSKHGHRGSRGPAGPVGSTGATGATGATGSGFAVAADEALVFNFNILLNIGLIDTGPIATFVQKPDGTVVLGPTFSSFIGLLQSGQITIAPNINGPVQIGTYHWGYVFPPSILPIGVTLGVTLNDFVNEQPSNENVFPANNVLGLSLNLLNTGETQYTHSFSFDVE